MREREPYLLGGVELPRWLLAIGPVVVLGVVLGGLFVTSPFGTVEEMADASTGELLWVLTIVGILAGIVPVAIGMLWFPFIRSLDSYWIHAVLALSAGILAFVAVEMLDEIIGYAGAVSTPYLGESVAVLGIGATFVLMQVVSNWRHRKSRETADRSGLQVAYLVAIGLGLHSIGEGIAIGSAFVLGETTLLTLLVIGFILHNVTEGPTVVAAVARDTDDPPLRHFAAMGLLAGGPVVVGGWIGSLVYSPLLAVLFFALAIGAIVQVVWEVIGLIKFDAERVITGINVTSFVFGLVLMFVLEDLIVEGVIF